LRKWVLFFGKYNGCFLDVFTERQPGGKVLLNEQNDEWSVATMSPVWANVGNQNPHQLVLRPAGCNPLPEAWPVSVACKA
jgi:hypothetical protein